MNKDYSDVHKAELNILYLLASGYIPALHEVTLDDFENPTVRAIAACIVGSLPDPSDTGERLDQVLTDSLHCLRLSKLEERIDALQASLNGQSFQKQLRIVKELQELSARYVYLKRGRYIKDSGGEDEEENKQAPTKQKTARKGKKTNTTIHAIETIYNGHRFRSRLEARWAVFFDACGIKYEYEPEGFKLEDGTCYLPDFLVYVKHRSDTDIYEPVYVEVKGQMLPPDRTKIEGLSKHHPVYVVGNFPADISSLGYAVAEDYYSFFYMDGDDYQAWFSKYNNEWWLAGPDHEEWDLGKNTSEPLKIAKYARFEHGETPNLKGETV